MLEWSYLWTLLKSSLYHDGKDLRWHVLRNIMVISLAKTLCLKMYNPGTDTICNMNAENYVYVALIFGYALAEFVANTADSPTVLFYCMELEQHGISHSGLLIFSRERSLHENLIKCTHKALVLYICRGQSPQFCNGGFIGIYPSVRQKWARSSFHLGYWQPIDS